MRTPIVIVHGWSDTKASFKRLGEFLRDNLKAEVSVIDLANWLSLDDEVTYQDLRRAMQKAWEDQPNLAGAKEVNVVAHSTGALVVRDWMTSRYPDGPGTGCPVKRLLMLAPANFGSPLAHLGASFLGRVLKGYKTGLQTGTHILSGLELASEYTWELAQRDVFSATQWYGKSAVMATVLVGNEGYPGLQGVVNEVGSDGTVRVSTANLNAAHGVLEFADNGSDCEFRIDTVGAERETAFGVLDGLNHNSITKPTSAESVHGKAILDALRVVPAGYDAMRESLTRQTDNLYRGAADKYPYYHGYQNTVVRAFDKHENPVEEYLVDFHQEKKRRDIFSATGLDSLFRQSFIKDVHNFKGNSAYRSFYLDVSAIEKERIDSDLYLDVDPQPRCDVSGKTRTAPVGYPEVSPVLLDPFRRYELFQANRTLLLDVVFPRAMIRDKVFDIRPM